MNENNKKTGFTFPLRKKIAVSFLSAIIASTAMTNAALSADEKTVLTMEEKQAAHQWLVGFKAHARQNGVDESIIKQAFANWQPVDKVIYYDRRQPEFSRTFWDYINRSVVKSRINRGKKLLKTHEKLLNDVYKKFGVQPRFLVAFWGLETNFGDYTGGFPVIDALATLAADERRRDFFTNELILALKIVQSGHIPMEKMSGSWAGAMGQTQFMPSTFTNHAFDGDGDGKKDLWGSLSDVMHSSANYLSKIGWDGEKTWGREVKLPSDFDYEIADLKVSKSLDEWQALGVRRAWGADLPNVDIKGSIVLPAGHKGPAFLVYNNFNKIMNWNRSIFYALAVGHLADRLIDKPGFAAKAPKETKPLHRKDVIALQQSLNNLGYDTGKPDGILGSKTRRALKNYQIKNGLPADGYPEHDLVERIIQTAN